MVKMSHAARSLGKACALLGPAAPHRFQFSELLRSTLFEQAKELAAAVTRAHFVVKIGAHSYELFVFDDECVVLRGPEGETDEITGWRHRDGDDGTPGGVYLEPWSTAPAWVTPALVDALQEASIRLC